MNVSNNKWIYSLHYFYLTYKLEDPFFSQLIYFSINSMWEKEP